jgi:hypothetical protein
VDFSSGYSVMDQSACCAASPTATVIVPAMRLKTIRTIGIAFNSDDGKNNHRRRFGICVDIFAAARARVVGKSDDFTHCSPPSAPGMVSLVRQTGIVPQLKDLQG